MTHAPCWGERIPVVVSFSRRTAQMHVLLLIGSSPIILCFFASQCAKEDLVAPTRTALTYLNVGDHRMRSLAAAVEFAKKNNMLGLVLSADELTRVPTLIDDIRDAGLVICAYGSNTGKSANQVDAFLEDGMVIYREHGVYG